MNRTIEELIERKSVRAFTDQPITAELKRTIIQAAMEAVHHPGYHGSEAEGEIIRDLRPPALYRQGPYGADFLRGLSEVV